ncbi:MAG: redoxin domain-containing protein [Gammaproteobacteria bacterium]|nr:redoxin domain-containing protein [Gammaproteobacteria bacterium]
MSRILRNLLILVIVAGATVLVLRWEESGMGLRASAAARSFAGKFPAPDFPAGLDWINTSGRALSLEDLRGKVVLLDFWTYGCINCVHIIPDLKKLEAKYPDELVVIGVHSAKFENEGVTSRIASIVHRYELEHPVVNDRDFAVWSAYGARAWPTLVLIDPDGKAVGSVSGEGHYDLLDEIIGSLIAEFDELGKISRKSLGFTVDYADAADTFLRFPGKILADGKTKRLYIADSNHHRIVVSNFDGEVLQIIGSGEPGLKDGSYEEASFKQPQGLTLDGNGYLYVADTENHALRRIDLEKETVATLAGTGKQNYLTGSMYKADGTGLNSPWDVLYHDGNVYIAMAGQHQLWRYTVAEEQLMLFAGTGREALDDGDRLRGGLNQPSGLATDGERIFFADSEASAIRYAEVRENGDMETIVGTGLFDFGDIDGKGNTVRLQHPLGVDYQDGQLFIADTYNDKIKRVDPEARTSTTIAGGEGELNEPGGLSISGDRIYIADTNNHEIKVFDITTGELSSLMLQ